MTELFNKVREFVKDNFRPGSMPHFDRTVYWLQQLKPEADEVILIAAMGHDIGRALFRKEHMEMLGSLAANDDKFLNYHQRKSADVMVDFLRKNNASEELVNKVEHLVLHHEVGGDEDSDLLKDADSISYFENNAPRFIQDKWELMGYVGIKKKFDWMYERISSNQAKKIAEPMYGKMIKELEQAKLKHDSAN